jgi:ABC-type Na+ efflux pump permease subunit
MNPRIRAVFRKELRDFRRNKFVIGTMVALPLFFVLLPIGNVLSIKAGTAEAAVRGVVGGASLTFFLVPLILPTVIAGYGVIGEREQATLEPVLTTPVRESELLIGKALAAAVPSVVIAYVMFAVYVSLVNAFAVPEVVDIVVRPAQFVAVILFAPLLSLFSIWVGLAFSARASDVRVAQQLSGLSMLPMLGLLALFTFQVVSPSVQVAVIGAVGLIVLDAMAWRVVSAMFDRERLLTRYGKS